jgi:hypothetical protein
MANKVLPGYQGLAFIDDEEIRCTSFSVNPKQESIFYNHVMGLRDTVDYNTSNTKGILPETGKTSKDVNTQRRIWRPGVVSVAGGISFPATENNLASMFEKAKYASLVNVDYVYYCNSDEDDRGARSFINGRINSFELSVSAGEIININTDFMFCNIAEYTGSKTIEYTLAEKLITWDKIGLTFFNVPFAIDETMIQSFNFRINNNIMPIYVSGDSSKGNVSDSLFPLELRVGMQEVSGTVVFYIDQGQEFIAIDQNLPSEIRVTLPGLTFTMYVVFQTSAMDGLVGPVITQMPFVGVDKVFS